MSGGEQSFWIFGVSPEGGCCWWIVCALQKSGGWGMTAEHGKSRGCQTRKEVVKDRPVPVCDEKVIGPQTVSFLMGDSFQ